MISLHCPLWNLTAQLSKANSNYLISSYCPKHVGSCKYRYLLCPTYILKGRNLQKINIFTYFYAGSWQPAACPAFPSEVEREGWGVWVIQSHDIKAAAQKQGVHPSFSLFRRQYSVFFWLAHPGSPAGSWQWWTKEWWLLDWALPSPQVLGSSGNKIKNRWVICQKVKP